MKVLIDAGHGIDTPGKRSPDGRLLEYKWNREVADLVSERLDAVHIPSELVVTETNDVSLRTRVLRINKVCDSLGPKNVLLISIHSDALGDGKRWENAQGWSCYTSVGETGSDELAECLYDAFERAFPERRIRKERSDGDRDYESNFYILAKSKCRAVLIENFFYTHKEECAWLLEERTKARIADAIVAGLKIYLSEI